MACVLLTGCDPEEVKDDAYGSGYITVDEQMWSENYQTPYPFTVDEGKILCGYLPGFSREVYFEPKGYTDGSYIATPLNKSAVEALVQANMITNVPYSIKQGANLV